MEKKPKGKREMNRGPMSEILQIRTGHHLTKSRYFPFSVPSCHIQPTKQCTQQLKRPIYRYNAEKGKCEKTTQATCHKTGFNGYWKKQDCQHYCEKSKKRSEKRPRILPTLKLSIPPKSIKSSCSGFFLYMPGGGT